jgi:hypothetical protein
MSRGTSYEQQKGRLGDYLFRPNTVARLIFVDVSAHRKAFHGELCNVQGMAEPSTEIVFVPVDVLKSH